MRQETATKKRSILAWIGGKSLLAEKIIPLMPPHHCYCEVFAGAAWLLFKKPESKAEVINDINSDLVTLYRVIKYHLDEFIRYLRWLLAAREEFERFKAMRPETLTDIQRAVRFYYLHRSAFAPGLASPVFRSGTTHKAKFNLLRIEEDLSAAHLRLAGVTIENQPFTQIIARFDKPWTFFYIDPPYYGCERYYGKGQFERDDFGRLAEQLRNIKGKFCMSINDVPEIRRLFNAFRIRSVPTTYSVGAAKQKPVRELLIMNYVPRGRGALKAAERRRARR